MEFFALFACFLTKGFKTVILLYDILEEKRPQIITSLCRRIPKEVRPYGKIPRIELQEAIDQFLDAFLNFLITGDDARLRRLFGYVAQLRFAQGFSMSTVLKAILCFLPTTQELLYSHLVHDDPTDRALYGKWMFTLQQTTIQTAGIFTEAYQEHVQSQVDNYNQYLEEQKKQLGVDLSRFILFRA